MAAKNTMRMDVSIPQWCDCCVTFAPSPAPSDHVSIPQWCDCCRRHVLQPQIAPSFQSHNGAIAAPILLYRKTPTCRFQSHNGAIAASGVTAINEPGTMFQSHNGAIAARLKRRRSLTKLPVSIPQWCDCCLQFPLLCPLGLPGFNPTMVRLLLAFDAAAD